MNVPRRVALGLGGALLGGGALLLLAGITLGVALELAIPGLVLIAAVMFERWRYQRVADRRPGPDWVATEERFVDPESGRLITVFYQPTTGERRYVGS